MHNLTVQVARELLVNLTGELQALNTELQVRRQRGRGGGGVC